MSGQAKDESVYATQHVQDTTPADEQRVSHDADVNIGLLVTLILSGGLFLVTLLFATAGFFNYMAYQERLEKVVNQPYSVNKVIQPQLVQLTQRAEIPITQAMNLVVEQYETSEDAGPATQGR